MTRICVTFFCLYFICISSTAQNETILGSVHGITQQKSPNKSFDWKAQWIWMDEQVDADVMLARGSFELREEPEQAQLRITATSQYQLFINGRYVCQGPARSAPHHQSFDIWDVRKLLQTGENTLAVRVHKQEGKYSYHHDGRAGLLAQLDISSGANESSVVTDKDWKVFPDPSWSDDSPKINRFQQVVSDRVDFRRSIERWNQPDFSDSTWPGATVLMRNVGWPGPQPNAQAQALTPPWTSLVPRDIPYLLEKEERAVNLIEAIKIDQLASEGPIRLAKSVDRHISEGLLNYQNGSQPMQLPATASSATWFLLFDFGKVLNGMPRLDIQGTAGTAIDIRCAPFMVNNEFTHHILDSDFGDQIILSGERDVWEATYWKPTRYMGVLINGENPVKLYSAGIRHLTYPFEKKGSIQAKGEPWVERYMEASAETIRVCTTDGYTDNYRERRQYAQTGYYAALGNYWIFGDLALQRRYLVQVAQEQEANGMMPAYAPLAADDYMIIMDSNCLWIRSLRNYFLYSGDDKTIKELLPAAIQLLELLHSFTNSLGLIDDPPYAYWLDHALNDRRGANFNLNGHYLGALEDFYQILDWLDQPGKEEYHARADLLRQSLQTHLWDAERQLFADSWIDGELSNQFSEHANAMALAMEVATEEQAVLVAKELLADDEHNYIKRASGITMVTPAMSYFLHRGLCNYGHVDESFNMLQDRFDKMLEPNTNGTLWEEWWRDGTGRSGTFQGGRTRSDAQTESAFTPALLGEFLLGVRPTKPGLREVEIYRSKSMINQISGTVPSLNGNLHVSWKFQASETNDLMIEIPAGMSIKLDVESLRLSKNQILAVDGKDLAGDKLKEPYIILLEGPHRVTF